MLAVLTAAVSACVVLTLVNLVVLFAVVRRLREQPQTEGPQIMAVPRNTAVLPFETTTADGATITEKDVFSGVVAFVTPSCGACKDLVNALRDHDPELFSPLLLVVMGELTDEIRDVVAALDGAVQVVAGPATTAVSTAFGGIESFPSVVRVDGGVVGASGVRLDAVLAIQVPVGML
ncbi:hypothetical protein FKR81_11270 [Lentzea tibetensis]|uniref:Thioredoxin domain-containing protein n=1 Tax=Lentzea tibetensis TaxID=2591470 RepID=A0A563EWW9_9PSEU|nr:hypothetical protein [Lentzea tibetensis]TWP52153.1 hypothetical protein FKR81_11270 [Lentzea tibetensis]